MALPLVSVALVTRNHEAFIREAIESALAQDYLNLEIVVSDDGSTDATARIAAEYPVRLVRSVARQGIAQNCNAALEACRGDLIAWHSGDDVMLPGKISALAEAMTSGVSLAYHDLDVFADGFGHLYRYNRRFRAREGGLAALLRHGTFNGACATMTRRTSAKFDARYPLACDWLFWCATLRKGGKIAHVPEVLGRYRKHDASATRDEVSALRDHIGAMGAILKSAPWMLSAALPRVAILHLALWRRALKHRSRPRASTSQANPRQYRPIRSSH